VGATTVAPHPRASLYPLAVIRSFADLTLRGRARRLRPLAMAALARYDVDVQRVRLLRNAWNCVFRVDTDRGPLALRICIAGYGHTHGRVQSEAVFLEALARDSDLGGMHPLRTRDGQLVVTAGADGVPEERLCALFSWVRGQTLSRVLDQETAADHGELHARLHAFGAAWAPPPDFEILDHTRVFHHPAQIRLWEAELFGHGPLFRDAWAASDERIAAVRARDPVIVTHGDLHQNNVLVHRGALQPIDFEDMTWATRGQDAATSLYYLSLRPELPGLRAAFQRGYERREAWPEGAAGEIDALLFPRALVLLNLLSTDAKFRVRDWEGLVGRTAKLARLALA